MSLGDLFTRRATEAAAAPKTVGTGSPVGPEQRSQKGEQDGRALRNARRERVSAEGLAVLRRLIGIELALRSVATGQRDLRDLTLERVMDLSRRRQSFSMRWEGSEQLAEFDEQIARARAELDKLNAQSWWLEPGDAIRQLLDRVLPQIGYDREVIGFDQMVAPRLLDVGAPERTELDRLTRTIAALDEQIAGIVDAALPVDDAIVAFDRVSSAERRVAAVQLQSLAYGNYARTPQVTLGLLQLLLPAGELERQLRAYLGTAIDAPGLPLVERPAAVAKLQVKRRELLIEEERAVVELEAGGFVVARRRDVDVQVLLEAWS